MMKRVTATYIVELDGDLARRNDEEAQEFVWDMLQTGGPRDLEWKVEEIEDE